MLDINQNLKALGLSAAGVELQQKTNKITVLKAFVRTDVFSFHAIVEISHMRSQITLFVNLRLCHITHSVKCTEAKAPNEIAAREREVTVVSRYDQLTRAEAGL